MNAIIATIIRHSLTFLAGIGGILATCKLIASTDVAAANAAGASLVEPVTLIGGMVAACIIRLAMTWLSLQFPWLAPLLGFAADASGPATGPKNTPPFLLLGLCAAAGCMGCLPSCSSYDPDSIPIKGCVLTDYGKVCYDSNSGVEITVDAESGK